MTDCLLIVHSIRREIFILHHIWSKICLLFRFHDWASTLMILSQIPYYRTDWRSWEIRNIYLRSKLAWENDTRAAQQQTIKSRFGFFPACERLVKNLSIYNERWSTSLKVAQAKTSIGLTRRRSVWVFRVKKRVFQKRSLWRHCSIVNIHHWTLWCFFFFFCKKAFYTFFRPACLNFSYLGLDLFTEFQKFHDESINM